jgi:hypothetical protein
MSRRIFNFDNQEESKVISSLTNKSALYPNTVSACGCLFYRDCQDDKELMLISYDDKNWIFLDDYGGQIDELDQTLFDAIARETYEESNGLITKKIISNLLSGKTKTFYTPFSKYYVIVVKVDDTFFPDTSVFGDTETHDKIKRKVNWYKFSDARKKLSQRLRGNNELMNFLS